MEVAIYITQEIQTQSITLKIPQENYCHFNKARLLLIYKS